MSAAHIPLSRVREILDDLGVNTGREQHCRIMAEQLTRRADDTGGVIRVPAALAHTAVADFCRAAKIDPASWLARLEGYERKAEAKDGAPGKDHTTSAPRHGVINGLSTYLGQHGDYDLWLTRVDSGGYLQAHGKDGCFSDYASQVGPDSHPALRAAWDLADRRGLLKTEQTEEVKYENLGDTGKGRSLEEFMAWRKAKGLPNFKQLMEERRLLHRGLDTAREPAAVLVARIEAARHVVQSMDRLASADPLLDAATAFLVRQFRADLPALASYPQADFTPVLGGDVEVDLDAMRRRPEGTDQPTVQRAQGRGAQPTDDGERGE